MSKLIDIIIPAYKAQDTIDRTLASIATQSLADKIQVTIVNDKDEIGYKKHIKKFSDMVDIEEIELKQNGGPGVARQVGLMKTRAPYVTFIDADDTFNGPFSIEMMLSHINFDDSIMVSVGAFMEQRGANKMDFTLHENDEIWMFGKMYRRSFLKKYKIQFSQTRSNEDTGFNAIVKLCSNEKEKINYYTNHVYIWWFKEDSITRINNFEYTYNQSFVGYTQNMMYAINHARAVQPFNKKVDIKVIEVMASLYIYWLKTKHRDERFIDQNFKWSKAFYDTQFVEVMKRIPQSHIMPIVARILVEQAEGYKDIVPDITFYDFINELDQFKETEETKESESD